MLRLYDRVKQATATSGSGSLTIGTSVPGFNVFSDFYNTGDLTYYVIEDLDNNEFEVGIGTYSGAFLTRDSVLTSSNSGGLVNLEGNTNTFVFATYAASGSVYTSGDRIITNVDGADFNLGATPEYREGRVFYDSTNHALAVYNDESEITLQVGQENYIRVRNNTGSTITNGQAVKIEGSQGTNTTVVLAIATGDLSSQAIGLATHDIEDNSFGYITTFGMVNDLDTSDFLDGDEVFLSDVISGGLTGVSPTAPSYKVPLGHVVRSHPSVGNILVQPGFAKLGGGDVKSLGDIQKSGVPFLDIIANGGSAAVLSSDPSFRFDSSNNVLYVPNIDVSGDLSASNGAGTSGQLLMSQGDGQPTVWTDAPSSTGISQGVAFFDSQNVLTGESEFSYDSGNNILNVENITLSGNITNPQDTATSEAFGNSANVNGSVDGLALGNDAAVTGSSSRTGPIAIGKSAKSYDNYAVSIGFESSAIDDDAIGIGKRARAKGRGTIAIGSNAKRGSTAGVYDVAIGNYAGYAANNSFCVNIGGYAGNSSNGDSCIYIGDSAGWIAAGEHNICLGFFAGRLLDGNYNILLGYNIQRGEGNHNIGFGYNALGRAVGTGNLEILPTNGPPTSILNGQNYKINIAGLIRGDHSAGTLGVNTDTTPEAALHVDTPNSTTTTSIFRGALSQSTNLTEWQDSAGGELAFVDYSGNASFQDLFAQNFTVTGTFTYLNSQNVTILDKQLELASDSGTAISGDAAVDEGGIVLKSLDGDKEWIWRDSTDSWTTNQNIDVGSNAVIFNGVSQTQAFLGNASVIGTPSGIAFYGPTSGITDDPELYYDSSSNILYVDNIYGSGTFSNSQGYSYSESFGDQASFTGSGCVSIGFDASSSGGSPEDQVIIGKRARGNGRFTVAVGADSIATQESVAIGRSATAQAIAGIAIGHRANAGTRSICIGEDAGTLIEENDVGKSIYIGDSAGQFLTDPLFPVSASQIGIGRDIPGLIGTESVVIGNFAGGDYNTNCILIGEYAGAQSSGYRNIEFLVNGANNSPITAGMSDKLNIGGLIGGDRASGVVGINTSINPEAALHVDTPSTTTKTTIFRSIAAQSTNISEWQDSAGTVVGSVSTTGRLDMKDVYANGIMNNPVGGFGSLALGQTTLVSAYNTAIGLYADSQVGSFSVSLGAYTKTRGGAAVAIGSQVSASGSAIGIGSSANAAGFRSIVIGNAAQAFGSYSISIGNYVGLSNTSGNCISIGNDAGANYTQKQGISMGDGAGNSLIGAYNIAIGKSSLGAAGTASDQVVNCIGIGKRAGIAIGGDFFSRRGAKDCVAIGANSLKSAPGTGNLEIRLSDDNPLSSPCSGLSNKINIEGLIRGDWDAGTFGINTDMTQDAALHVNSPNSATTTSIFRAAASQATRVAEWQDSSSSIMASVGSEGTISTTGSIHVFNSGDIDGFDYERLEITWDSNIAYISTAIAGGGIQRQLWLEGQGVTALKLTSSQVRVGTNLRPNNASSFELGSNSTRWSTTYTDGISTNVETYTSGSVILDDKNNVVLGDCTSGALTVNLQTAVGRRGLQYNIKKIDSTANVVTIDPSGTQTIDGQLSGVLSAQYNFLTIVSDDSNWFVIGSG